MTMSNTDQTTTGPFGLSAEPRPSAREAIQDMLDAGLLDDLMGRIDDGTLQLTGDGGFIPEMVKAVLERGLNAELTSHLGYAKGDPAGRVLPNSRNGTTPKTVHSEVGSIPLDIPRDRNASFEPRLVPKGERQVGGLADMIVSLYAGGMTVRDIQAHLARTIGTELSHETISNITDAVLDEVKAWQSRPLDPVYPIIYLDALVVKVRDSHQVRNKAAHIAVGVDLDGVKHVLGIWVQTSEGAKFWAGVLAELRNRGIQDTLIVCCDGLTGFPEAIEATWPRAIVQTSSVHHGGGGMVPLLGCTVTVRTYANEHRGRSTCRPVRRWRGRPGIDWPAGSSTFECRDEVPGNRARRAGCRPSAAEGAAWSRRCPPRRSSVLTGAAANINCARLMTPGKC